jgi:hypothetical protein
MREHNNLTLTTTKLLCDTKVVFLYPANRIIVMSFSTMNDFVTSFRKAVEAELYGQTNSIDLNETIKFCDICDGTLYCVHFQ